MRRDSESGHLMAGLTAAVAILLIASAVAFQEWSERFRREMEAEMMFRAQDLTRALYRYERAAGRLPNSMDELMQPGPSGQYFLRKKWEDPLVADGKWVYLYAAPGGGIYDPTASGDIPGLSGGAGGLAGPGNPLGETGSLSNSDFGQRGDDRDAPFGSGGREGDGPRGKPGERSGFGSRLGPGGGDGEGGIGLPIAGVKTKSSDTPFRVWNDLSEYRLWLFTIQDLKQKRQRMPGAGGGAVPGGTPPRGPGGAPRPGAPADGGGGLRPRGGR